MADLKGLQTHKNLKDAFSEEAGVMQRYLYFAKIADIEGFPDVAQLFRDFAEGGICNAHGNMDFLERVGDPNTDMPIGETDSNLAAAISSEMFEYTELYPLMANVAHGEGFPDIASWFETLTKLKRAHVNKLKEALKKMNGSTERVAG